MIGVTGTAWADTTQRAKSMWDNFRKSHPYHVQIVALSDSGKDGERIVVISEPPPTLLREHYKQALASVFGREFQSVGLFKQPMGYDGWVEDIVISLKYPLGELGDRAVREDLALLARRMFGTSYKFAPVRLGDDATVPTHVQQAPPSISASAAELNVWLGGNGSSLISLNSGVSHSLRDLLSAGSPGVYLTAQRGLVMLLLPRNEPLEFYRAEIRKFALDTDAIVGAVASGDKRLGIVGRERDTSLEIVQPLRAETILDLAQTQNAELGQSYERQSAFAGKQFGGDFPGADWAPIYLSHDLINTEFGSLLNLTDQMLKSWSEAGRVHYINFPYKAPETFPFPGGLLRHLGTHKVTYNWNTVGVGSVSAFDELRIFALNRTGSLPVSYFPEGDNAASVDGGHAVAAENTAYDYFSSLRDPYLGRVVQYTAFFQIFRAFPVHAARDSALAQNDRAPHALLLSDTRRALDDLLNKKAVPNPNLVTQEASLFARAVEPPPTSDEQLELVRELNKNNSVKIVEATRVIQDLVDTYGQQVVDPISLMLAERNEVGPRFEAAFKSTRKLGDNGSEQEKLRWFETLSDVDRANLVLLQEPGELKKLLFTLSEALLVIEDPANERQRFALAADPIESGYIKTPSVVLSLNEEMSTGGHNLYSHVTRIELDSNVAVGKVAFTKGGDGAAVLRINPADSPRSGTLARTYERNAGAQNVGEILNSDLAHGGVVRDVRVALAVKSETVGAERGLTLVERGDRPLAGFRPEQSRAVDLAKVQRIAGDRNLDVVIARDHDGYLVYRIQPKPTATVHASTETSLMEAVDDFTGQTARSRMPGGEPPVRLGTAGGLSEGELRGIAKTQELRTAAGGGGWKPPTNYTTAPVGGPEGQPLKGHFFKFADEGEGAGSTGDNAYLGRNDADEPIVLQLATRGAHRVKALVGPIDWSRAEIKPLRTFTGTGSHAGAMGVNFEIILPIKTVASIANKESLIIRVIAYFKGVLTKETTELSNSAVNAAVKSAMEQDAVGIDTIAALKAEIIKNVKPSSLEFHINDGERDLVITRADDAFPG